MKDQPENSQHYKSGDKVIDRWGEKWTIAGRYDIFSPIRYDVKEKKNGPLNQSDITGKA